MNGRAWGAGCLSIAALLPAAPGGLSVRGGDPDVAPRAVRVESAVSIPADLEDHALYVDVSIDGKGPFHMLVDTGCAVTLVSPEVAAKAGEKVLPPDPAQPIGFNAVGDTVSVMGSVTLASLDLGGAHFEGVPAGVSAAFGKFSKIDGRRLDGLLGYPLFAGLYVAIDFPRGRLVLARAWPKGLPPVRAVLPVTERSGVPFVRVRVQGRTLAAMIDTGSNGDLQVPPELAADMVWKHAPRAGPLVAVLGETGREWIGRLSGPLELGNVRQPDPVATVSEGPPSIGVRLLENFCVILHEPENRLWLCASVPGPAPSPVEHSIGLSLISDAAGWKVAGIIPGSPAERAHLAVGELVTRIEGRPACDWSRDQIGRWIDSHDSVSLALTGPSGRRDLTLRVWALVP